MTYRRSVRFKREFAVLPLEIKRLARAKFALFSRNWRTPPFAPTSWKVCCGMATRFLTFGSLTDTACSSLLIMK